MFSVWPVSGLDLWFLIFCYRQHCNNCYLVYFAHVQVNRREAWDGPSVQGSRDMCLTALMGATRWLHLASGVINFLKIFANLLRCEADISVLLIFINEQSSYLSTCLQV